MRMAEMAEMGIGNKPCLDIRPSQDQISDRSISYAQLAKGLLSLLLLFIYYLLFIIILKIELIN